MYPRNGKLLNSERFCRHCRSERRWGAGRHVVWCGISLRIFLDGSRGVNSFIRKSFFQKKHWSGQAGSREFGKWEVFRWLKWVAVGRYGLSMGGNESYGFWEAFGTPPGPQNGKKIEKSRKSGGKKRKIRKKRTGCLGNCGFVIKLEN